MSEIEIPYACGLCQESFPLAEGLINHVKTKHDLFEFASGGNWGSRRVFLQRTGEFSESGELPQIPMTFLQFL